MKNSGQFQLDGNFQECEDEFIKRTNFDVYLVSGGPIGKIWMNNMAFKYNKVMIDIGQAMIRSWARSEEILCDHYDKLNT